MDAETRSDLSAAIAKIDQQAAEIVRKWRALTNMQRNEHIRAAGQFIALLKAESIRAEYHEGALIMDIFAHGMSDILSREASARIEDA